MVNQKNVVVSLFAMFIISGCSNGSQSQPSAGLPPVVAPNQNYSVLKGKAEFNITSSPNGTASIELVKKSYAAGTCSQALGNCLDYSDITVTNSGNTIFEINKSQQSLTYNTSNGNLTSFLTLDVIKLTDNSLFVCGNNSKCDLGLIRMYTTGTPGLYNSATAQSIPLLVSSPYSSTNMSVGTESNHTTVQQFAIAGSEVAVSLADLIPNSNYVLSSDFTQAGAGTYTAHVVVEYVLTTSTPPSLAITSPDPNSLAKSGVTLQGICESGSNVTISGDIQSGPISASCSSGQFSQAILFSSGDGTKNISVSQTNQINLTSTDSRSFIEKNVGPLITLGAGSPQLVNNTGTINYPVSYDSSASQVTLAPSNVILNKTGTASCSISVSGSGQSQIISLNNCSGDGTVGVSITAGTASDSIGNLSLAAGPSSLATVDNTAPALTQTQLASTFSSNGSSVSPGGACEIGEPVVISLSGSNLASVPCLSGTWAYTTPTVSSDGIYTYTMAQTDGAGNSTTLSLNWMRDTTAPMLASVAITNNSPTDTSVYGLTFGSTSGNPAQYCILENSINSSLCSWVNLPLPSSDNVSSTNNAKVLTVFLRNSLGTISSPVSSNSVILDTVAPAAPTVALNSPAVSPDNIKNVIIQVSGTEANATVALYSNSACSSMVGSSAVASGSSTNISLSNLSDGSYTFFAKQTDQAGNASNCSAASANYVLKTTIPTLSITTPITSSVANAGNVNSFPVSGNCSEAGRSVMLAVSSVTGSASCNGTTWSGALNLSGLSDGPITLTANLSDIAGNNAPQASVAFLKLSNPLAVTPSSGTISDDSTQTLNITGGLAPYSASITTNAGIGSSFSISGSTLTYNVGDNSTSGNLAEVLTVSDSLGTQVSASFSISPTVFNLIAVDDATSNGSGCYVYNSNQIRCWGSNTDGGTGIGSPVTNGPNIILSPVKASQVTSITGTISSLVMNGGVSYAISGSQLYAWGANTYGTLGNGSTTDSITPVTPAGFNSGVTKVVGDGIGTCAIKSGGAYCWGTQFQQLPTSGVTETPVNSAYLTPFPITGFTSGVTDISLGDFAGCLIQTGSVWCWGNGGINAAPGIIGNGSSNAEYTAPQFTGLSGATQVVVGYQEACALVNGGVQCWGQQIGDGTYAIYESPVSLIPAGSGVTAIYGRESSFCGYFAVSNTYKCWGDDSDGELGAGVEVPGNQQAYTLVNSPEYSGNNITSFYMGGYGTCGIYSGIPKCVGGTGNGVFGLGGTSVSTIPVLVPTTVSYINPPACQTTNSPNGFPGGLTFNASASACTCVTAGYIWDSIYQYCHVDCTPTGDTWDSATLACDIVPCSGPTCGGGGFIGI
jgi:hypothetical protein